MPSSTAVQPYFAGLSCSATSKHDGGLAGRCSSSGCNGWQSNWSDGPFKGTRSRRFNDFVNGTALAITSGFAEVGSLSFRLLPAVRFRPIVATGALCMERLEGDGGCIAGLLLRLVLV